jgi:hypothetical protein
MFNQGIYSKSSGGGGTGQGITAVVANYSALPLASAAPDEFYFVESPQGTAWLPGSLGGTYYPAGLYYSNGVTWFYAESPYQASQLVVDAGIVTDQFVSPYTLANATTVERPLTFSTGLTRVANTITANISTGIAGGQTIYGGTAANENLTIQSTINATKGSVIIGTANGFIFDETNSRLALGRNSTTVTIGGSSIGVRFSVHSSSTSIANSEFHSTSNTASWGTTIYGTRARGTFATPAVIQSGDNILDIFALGYDGTDFAISSSIEHEAEGTIASDQIPGRILFKTANSTGTLTERWRVNSTGGSIFSTTISVSPAAVTTGVQVDFTFTGALNTNQTANAEVNRVLFTTNSRQWATGAITTQREFLIQAPTYSFVGASVITNAATLAISAAPIAGTNATITNSYSIWSQSGAARFDVGTGAVTIRDQTVSPSNSCIYMVTSALSGTNYTILSTNVSSFFNAPTTSGTAEIRILNSQRAVFSNTTTTFSLGVATTGAVTPFTFTSSANTGQTATTEIFGFNLNLSATRTWATGAITTQREFLIQAPTYSFVGASVITNAYTAYVSGSPIAGANATITNSYAMGVDGKLNLLNGNLFNTGTQVLGPRVTGWTSPTGTASRSGYATTTATVTQLAQTLKALIDDLTTHGIIGT